MSIASTGVRAAIAVLVVFIACAGREAQPARAADIQVSNTNNDGPGSLRAAILDANATPGHDRITFALGPGVHVFAPTTLLPTITEPLTIDGFCGTCGASPNTAAFGQPMNLDLKIVLSGENFVDVANAPFNGVGLRFAGANTVSDGSTVQGLVFRDWKESAITISESLAGAKPYVVRGNIIGSDETGTVARGGRFGVVVGGAPTSGAAIIGGSTASDRNLVAGHSVANIQLGAGVNHIVAGNYLGTKLNGNEAMLPTNASGGNIVLTGGTSGVTIGGLLPEERNLISGAPSSGISTATASNITVINNRIGTNAAGTAALGNLYGLSLSFSTNVSVGTMDPGSGNLISGNRQGGITLGSGGPFFVLRNQIGTNAAGTAAIPNGSAGSGYGVYTNFNTALATIGASDAGNTIVGTRVGIEVQAGSNVAIAGNTIGLPGMPNSAAGIEVNSFDLTFAAVAEIGSNSALDANVITHNAGPGILAKGNSRAKIGINEIEFNDGLPIDIQPVVGQNTNDAGDGDVGPNDFLNHPVITRALATATNLRAEMDLDLPLGTQATVYLYTGDSCTSGPQLGIFRGAVPVTINSPGVVDLTANVSATVPPGVYLSAVVTDETNGISSEAATCLEVRNTSDANCDSSVDAADALAVLRKVAGLTTNIPVTCDGQIVPAGDADGNGFVEIADALYIRRLAAALAN